MEIILDNLTVGALSMLNEPIGDTKSIRLRKIINNGPVFYKLTGAAVEDPDNNLIYYKLVSSVPIHVDDHIVMARKRHPINKLTLVRSTNTTFIYYIITLYLEKPRLEING